MRRCVVTGSTCAQAGMDVHLHLPKTARRRVPLGKKVYPIMKREPPNYRPTAWRRESHGLAPVRRVGHASPRLRPGPAINLQNRLA